MVRPGYLLHCLFVMLRNTLVNLDESWVYKGADPSSSSGDPQPTSQLAQHSVRTRFKRSVRTRSRDVPQRTD
jgi:hypothetical protein